MKDLDSFAQTDKIKEGGIEGDKERERETGGDMQPERHV